MRIESLLSDILSLKTWSYFRKASMIQGTEKKQILLRAVN